MHGTGRVKLNGAVKRSDSTTAVKPPPPPAAPAQPAAPVRQRTVIDQGPIPLYCSDECRMADLNSHFLALDFDPNREPPAVPHNSYTNLTTSEPESDSSGGDASSSDSSSWSSDSTKVSHVSPSMATLAALYNFPPMPAPAPILEHPPSQSPSPDHNFNEYQSGVMMAARRIKAALCPEPVKVSAFSNPAPAPATRQPIPGWTDGSDDWRATVYSLSAPPVAPKNVGDLPPSKAHSAFVASPHHSRGVHSTVSELATPTPHHSASAASLPPARPAAPTRTNTSYAEDIYSKYPLSFSRRSDSRTSLFTAASTTSVPTSPPGSARSSSRQRSLLKKGAEGKLLVPDVKLKARTAGSTLSISSSFDAGSMTSSWSSASRRSVHSPLSRQASEISVEQPASLPSTKRPAVESKHLPYHRSSSPADTLLRSTARSWSYDNLMTYPVMPQAPRREKRIERRVVDGVERDVEVVVEVVQPLKRLFLFADKDASR